MNDKTKEMIEDLFLLVKSQEKLIETLYKVHREDSETIKELRNTKDRVNTDNAYKLKYEALKGQYKLLEEDRDYWKIECGNAIQEYNTLNRKIADTAFQLQNSYERLA
jgi:hypothetical protein